MKFTLRHGEDVFTLEVEESDGGYRVSDGKRSWLVRLDERRGTVRTVIVDQGRHKIGVLRKDETWDIVLDGLNYEFLTRDARFERLLELGRAQGVAAGRAEMRAPIPGLVTKVLKSVGDAVKEGEPVLILSAMKLENELRAPRDGKLVEIRAKPGAAVEKGELLAAVD